MASVDPAVMDAVKMAALKDAAAAKMTGDMDAHDQAMMTAAAAATMANVAAVRDPTVGTYIDSAIDDVGDGLHAIGKGIGDVVQDVQQAMADPKWYHKAFDSMKRGNDTVLTAAGAADFCAHVFPDDQFTQDYRTCCHDHVRQQVIDNPCPGASCTGYYLKDQVGRRNLKVASCATNKAMLDARSDVMSGKAVDHVADFVSNQHARSSYLNNSAIGKGLNSSFIGGLWGNKF